MTQSNAQSESPENLKKIYGARFLGATKPIATKFGGF